MPSMTPPKLIGESKKFKKILSQIEKFAKYDTSILIQGETGTGKELTARNIHYLGARRGYPFVAVNCGALPDTLVENELFGNEKGAFTDAKKSRTGLVEEAEGGTLFLDEVDSLSLKAQVALLRFLQEQTYRPLGSSSEKTSNVRIVAAASGIFPKLLKNGQFRQDLAYRLQVLDITLPPLRERKGDPLLLADYFISKYATYYNTKAKQIDHQSIEWINRYSWPGNIRELENRVHQSLVMTESEILSLVPEQPVADRRCGKDRRHNIFSKIHFNEARDRILKDFEKKYLTEAIRKTGGNVTHAAKIAGKERRAFGRLLKKHAIDKSIYE